MSLQGVEEDQRRHHQEDSTLTGLSTELLKDFLDEFIVWLLTPESFNAFTHIPCDA